MPRGASRIVVDRSNYYFYDGFYYQPFQSGYVVVDAPIGPIIATLPRLHHQVMWRGSPYFIVGNSFIEGTKGAISSSIIRALCIGDKPTLGISHT